MKTLTFVIIMLLAYMANGAVVADSTKKVPAPTKKDSVQAVPAVKELSAHEYILSFDGKTVTNKPGDSIDVVAVAADSVKATGRCDWQMVKGKKIKVLEWSSAKGKTFWLPETAVVKADANGKTHIHDMLCDENEASESMAWYWQLGIAFATLAGLWFAFRQFFR